MIPKKLDYTKDECRGALRHLELQAYSSVVSTFRAQGSLDSNKQGVLDQLRKHFHISDDRHKAEVRRVANNEKLTTISETINGKNFDLEWIREGHRSYPLISRAPSYTALHLLAEHASKIASMDSATLPAPSETKRERNLSNEYCAGVPVVFSDQSKPPTISTTPASFGMNKKDLKRNIDLVSLHHPHSKKKHYHLKPPPPPPNVKIQHLYQTLNTKRPRKPFTKKSSKTKACKQSPAAAAAAMSSSRLQFPYPSLLPSVIDDNNGELQKHLTSQLMPPPMSPIKLNAYPQSSLPTTSASGKHFQKNNHQQPIEPQAHYIPNNRLKNNEMLVAEQHHMHHSYSQQQQQQPQPSRARSGRSKSISISSKSGNYLQQRFSNGASGIRNSLDHIPDPQIIFNTSSSSLSSSKHVDPLPPPIIPHVEISIPIESNDMEMSPAITSPLQLLSTAASCTPKLKVNTSPINHQTQQQQYHHHQMNSISSTTSSSSQLPTTTTTMTNQQASALKQQIIDNRAIKIVPANAKIIKPAPLQSSNDSKNKMQQHQAQTIIAGTPSKFKIQKFQLVMNKSQEGGASANLSPTATIVSGKAGQIVLTGKGITNTYQVGTASNVTSKPPYTILSSSSSSNAGNNNNNNRTKTFTTSASPAQTPKVVVQTIDRNFAQKDSIESNPERIILESQRITENTPIDFLPNTASTTSFPKVIIPPSATVGPKQIKLKLGPGSIVNSKIFKNFKGSLPGNLKIQRNINTKGFTVLNTSQIVQIQSASAAQTSGTNTITTSSATQGASSESTKTDWEQELDDVNRTKAAECGSKERILEPSNCSTTERIAMIAKKPRLDESVIDENMIIDESTEVVEVENMNEDPSSSIIYAENSPQVEEEIQEPTSSTEFVYLNATDDHHESEIQ